MKAKSVKEVIELVIYLVLTVIPLVLSILGITQTDDIYLIVILYVVFVVVLAYIIYFVTSKIKENRKFKQSMSTNYVLKNIKRHSDSLLKFAKANEKKLIKNTSYNEFVKNRLEENELIKKFSKDIDNRKKKAIQSKLDIVSKRYSDKSTIELIRKLSSEQDFKVAQLISKTFISMERLLLNAEQFETRIKFGHYISKYSFSSSERQRALLDFLGWTNMMIGEVKKGESYIFEGIKRAEEDLKYVINEKDKAIFIYNICRGYRHLGSARLTVEKNPEQSIEYLKLASKHFDLLNYDSKNEAYDEMFYGIKYGFLDAHYHAFVNREKSLKNSENDYEHFLEVFKEFDALIAITKDFQNKHRYAKSLVLRTKYIELFHDQYHKFKKIDVGLLNETTLKTMINEDLEVLQILFKNNIFLDEATEEYMEQKVKYLKYQLIETIKGV